jgi:hypothetical protein
MELLWPRFDHPWEASADLIRIYQTVSEEKFCELRPNGVLRSSYPEEVAAWHIYMASRQPARVLLSRSIRRAV